MDTLNLEAAEPTSIVPFAMHTRALVDTDWLSAAGTYAAAAAQGGPAAADAARTFAEFVHNRFAAMQWPGAAALANGPGMGFGPSAGMGFGPTAGVGAGTGAGLASGFGPASLLAHFPALGATREMQLRAQRIAAASARLEDAQRRLQQLCSNALEAAATDFAARLAPAPPGSATGTGAGANAGAGAGAWREWYDLWIECAEEAYARAAHSEAFCRALGDGVNAGAALRTELQAVQEQAAKVLDLPTRSEFNSLMQRLLSLERGARIGPAATRPARGGGKTPKARR